MIGLPAETRVWLASGATDMRRGFDGLALLVQEALKRGPHGGHLFVFRGKRGGLVKVPGDDGQGMCLARRALLLHRHRGSVGSETENNRLVFQARHVVYNEAYFSENKLLL